MATSAISSISNSRDVAGNHTETRTAAYIFFGDAASFREWKFCTRLYITGKSGDQHIEAMSKVCGRLRGDAFVVAQEVGFDNLCEIIDGRPRGIEALISHMRETDYSASTLVLKDPYLEKMLKAWNSTSRGDDVAGPPIRHITGPERHDTIEARR